MVWQSPTTSTGQRAWRAALELLASLRVFGGEEWLECPSCKERWVVQHHVPAHVASKFKPSEWNKETSKATEDEAEEEEGENEMWALEGLDVNDLFRREGKDGRYAADECMVAPSVTRLPSTVVQSGPPR